MSFDESYLRAAHKHCSANQGELRKNADCGCFYCLSIYPASELDFFLDDGTAVCARCPVDSVLGDASGFPIRDPNFLTAMHSLWFEKTVSWAEFEKLSQPELSPPSPTLPPPGGKGDLA